MTTRLEEMKRQAHELNVEIVREELRSMTIADLIRKSEMWLLSPDGKLEIRSNVKLDVDASVWEKAVSGFAGEVR